MLSIFLPDLTYRASGGELLDVLTRKTYITEYEVSRYICQLLLALDHMHEFNIAHLGLTVSIRVYYLVINVNMVNFCNHYYAFD